MDAEESYRFHVLDPLRDKASPRVWEMFESGELELNRFDTESFELFNGKELVGNMEGGIWNEC